MNITSDVFHALRRDLYPPTRCLWAEEVPVPGIAHLDGEPQRIMDAACIETKFKEARTIGFEVKVSRGDWFNDRSGEKAGPALMACDQFYYVFGSPDIYKAEEVKPSFGIIHIQDGHAVEVRPAALMLAPNSRDGDLYRQTLAAVVKRSLREEGTDFISRVRRDAEEQGRRKGLNEAKRRTPIIAKTKDGTRTVGHRYDPGRYNLDDGEPLDLP